MMQVSDPYLRERLFDLEDLANRLQQHLSGRPLSAAWAELPHEFILVARAMGPAELLDYARRRIMGLVLEEGSPTAHVAIVARAFDIPVVGRVDDATSRIEAGDIVVVDGDHANVLIRPSADIQQSIAAAVEARSRRRAYYETLRSVPAVTRDGIAIKLMLNAGLLLDLAQLATTGAEGVGLFRTEFPLMVRDTFPDVEEFTEYYQRVFDQAEQRPVFFRTLDIGGDKVLPYLPHTPEDNPAMGWRAIRIGLDRPAMLRQQLRALIRAARGRTLHVKFPMVAEVAELERARALVDMELARAACEGRELPESVKIGVMLEVPSLLWQLPALCERIDFLSVGTNDLLQFLFACDRGNPRLADRYDPLSAPMLALFREIVACSRAAGTSLSMCGDMAGNPLEAMVLIALGFTDIVDGGDRDRPRQDDDPQSRCRRRRRLPRRDRQPSGSFAAAQARSLRPRPRHRAIAHRPGLRLTSCYRGVSYVRCSTGSKCPLQKKRQKASPSLSVRDRLGTNCGSGERRWGSSSPMSRPRCGSSLPTSWRSRPGVRTSCRAPSMRSASYALMPITSGSTAARCCVASRQESTLLAAKPDLAFPMPLGERSMPGGGMLLVALILAVCAYGGWFYLSTGDGPRPERVAEVPLELLPYREPSRAPPAVSQPVEAQAAPRSPAAPSEGSEHSRPAEAGSGSGGRPAAAGSAMAAVPAATDPAT